MELKQGKDSRYKREGKGDENKKANDGMGANIRVIALDAYQQGENAGGLLSVHFLLLGYDNR
jgi:hypothetical protein